MQRSGQGIQGKPSYLVKFVWFTVFYFSGVYFDQVMKLNPVYLFAILNPKIVIEPEEGILYILCTIFFFYFRTQSFFDRFSEFNTTGTKVPTTMLIPTILAPFVHEIFTITIMTKIRNPYPYVIYPFFYCFIPSFIYACNSATLTRSCPPVSRSRTVTVSSSRVSKSTTMQYGVPISSCRR
jgi:hypothetical protein